LSFTHKTFQEFLAAVYISINEELFETVIKPRYAVVDQFSLDRCFSDLGQVFIFTCGLNIQIAEKIATLFNIHYRSDILQMRVPYTPFYKYCTRILNGIAEADENGFKHFNFPVQCIDMEIKNEYDASVCCRLLDMNIERLVYVFICWYRRLFIFKHYDKRLKVQSTLQLCLHKCTQLQRITLLNLDLVDQQLLLPDTLTNIEIKDVKVTGGIYLQYCSLLQTLKLKGVPFGKNELFLSAQNFKHLQELELVDMDLGDQEMLLPNSITSLCLVRVSTASGRNGDRNTSAQQQHNKHSAFMSFMDYPCLGPLMLQNCKKLKHIVLKRIRMNDHELLLPESITSITIDSVNGSKDVKLPLQHCTSLQKLDLAGVKLGDKLVLPDSITELELFDVTGCLSSFTSLHNLSRLQTLSLVFMDLCDLKLELCELEMSRGLLLHNCSQLRIEEMNLAYAELKLPDSITNIEMTRVTMSALDVQELCHHFQRLPHAVTFTMKVCTIEPLHHYEQFIKRLRTMTDVTIIERILMFGDKEFVIRFNCNTSAASSEL